MLVRNLARESETGTRNWDRDDQRGDKQYLYMDSVEQYLVDQRYLWCERHRQRHRDVQLHTQRQPRRSHWVTHRRRTNCHCRAERRRR
jgi:hypothetical protein